MPSMFGGVAVDDAPQAGGSRFGGIPVNETDQANQPENTSFLGEMGANLRHGIQSGKDLLSGNYEDLGRAQQTPKTEALASKVFPDTENGVKFGEHTIMGTLRHIGNTSPSDWSGALLEKFGNTPEGKALSVIGGVNPLYNAASTAVNREVNPYISEQTGIAPENLQLAEMAAAPLGFKKAGEINDPVIAGAKNVASNISDRFSKTEIPNAADIRGLASKAYQAADEQGGVLLPHISDAWVTKASEVLPQTAEGRTVLGDTSASKLIDNIQALRDKPITLQGAQEIDSALGDKMSSEVDPRTGKLNAEGNKILTIQQALRDTIENATESDVVGGKSGFESLKTGRDLWAASARMNDIERIMNRAEQTDNPVTAIKTGFRTLASNPSRLRGFTSEEVAAIQKAAKTGIVTNVLRAAGSRLGPLAAGAAGGVVSGGTLGAALAAGTDYAISGAARAGANALQRGRGNAVMESIANRPAVQKAFNAEGANLSPANISPSNPISSTIVGGALGEANQKLLPPAQMPESTTSPPAKDKVSEDLPNVESFAKAESGGNPNATNPNSSASGLYGFTNKTWAQMVAKYGKQTGIDLGDKSNPQAQATMAKLLAKDNIDSLQKTLGRLPSKGELYMAHFLGASGAAKLINADPNREAIMLFPRQVLDANHSVFFNGRQPRTVGEVYKLLNNKVA